MYPFKTKLFLQKTQKITKVVMLDLHVTINIVRRLVNEKQ